MTDFVRGGVYDGFCSWVHCRIRDDRADCVRDRTDPRDTIHARLKEREENDYGLEEMGVCRADPRDPDVR